MGSLAFHFDTFLSLCTNISFPPSVIEYAPLVWLLVQKNSLGMGPVSFVKFTCSFSSLSVKFHHLPSSDIPILFTLLCFLARIPEGLAD